MSLYYPPKLLKLPPGVQPQYPVEIDWSHPLSQGLVGCCTPWGEHVSGIGGWQFSGGNDHSVDNKGRALHTNSGTITSYARLPATEFAVDKMYNKASWTVASHFKQNSSTAANQTIFGLFSDDVADNEYLAGFRIDSADRPVMLWCPSGAFKGEGATTISASVGHNFIAEVNYGDENILHWVNGATEADSDLEADVGSTPTLGTPWWCIGNRNPSGSSMAPDIEFYVGYVWDRPLSNAELQSIENDPYQIFKPAVDFPVFHENWAYLRPDADDADGNWLTKEGGTTLYTEIDEVTPDETDHIISGANPSSDLARVRLANPTVDVDTNRPVRIRYRVKSLGEDTSDITVNLREGNSPGTIRETWTEPSVGVSGGVNTQNNYTTFTRTLANAASVTDWNDVYLDFSATKTGGDFTFTLISSDSVTNPTPDPSILIVTDLVDNDMLFLVCMCRTGAGHVNHEASDSNGSTWTKILGYDNLLTNSNARFSMSVWYYEATGSETDLTPFLSVDADSTNPDTVNSGLLYFRYRPSATYGWTLDASDAVGSGTDDWNATDSPPINVVASGNDIFELALACCRTAGVVGDLPTTGNLVFKNTTETADSHEDQTAEFLDGSVNRLSGYVGIKGSSQGGGSKTTNFSSDGQGNEGVLALITFKNV